MHPYVNPTCAASGCDCGPTEQVVPVAERGRGESDPPRLAAPAAMYDSRKMNSQLRMVFTRQGFRLMRLIVICNGILALIFRYLIRIPWDKTMECILVVLIVYCSILFPLADGIISEEEPPER